MVSVGPGGASSQLGIAGFFTVVVFLVFLHALERNELLTYMLNRIMGKTWARAYNVVTSLVLALTVTFFASLVFLPKVQTAGGYVLPFSTETASFLRSISMPTSLVSLALIIPLVPIMYYANNVKENIWNITQLGAIALLLVFSSYIFAGAWIILNHATLENGVLLLKTNISMTPAELEIFIKIFIIDVAVAIGAVGLALAKITLIALDILGVRR